MNKNAVASAYSQSFIFIPLLLATTFIPWFFIKLLFVEYIGNSHRSEFEVIVAVATFLPVATLVAGLGSVLVFAIPQTFQALIVRFAMKYRGEKARFLVLFAVPLTTVVTWYCYDYLTPSDMNLGINEGADWKPYEHGITLQRYGVTLAVQAPITLFSFLYFDSEFRRYTNKTVVLVAFFAALIIGGFVAYDRL